MVSTVVNTLPDAEKPQQPLAPYLAAISLISLEMEHTEPPHTFQ